MTLVDVITHLAAVVFGAWLGRRGTILWYVWQNNQIVRRDGKYARMIENERVARDRRFHAVRRIRHPEDPPGPDGSGRGNYRT